jgi:hypothetical protein
MKKIRLNARAHSNDRVDRKFPIPGERHLRYRADRRSTRSVQSLNAEQLRPNNQYQQDRDSKNFALVH